MNNENDGLEKVWLIFTVIIGGIVLVALYIVITSAHKEKPLGVADKIDTTNSISKGNSTITSQLPSTTSVASTSIDYNELARAKKELHQVDDGLNGDEIKLALHYDLRNATVFFKITYFENGTVHKKELYTKPKEYEVWDLDIKQKAKDEAMEHFKYTHSYDDHIYSIETYTYSEYWKGSQAYHEMMGEAY